MSSELSVIDTRTSLPDAHSDIAIQVNNLSKCFHVYDLPRHRLQQFILPSLRRLAGLPKHNYYREYWALQDVSFTIKKGETIGIVGKNGSGKSTLLQLICGTLSPTQGDIQTNGRIAALLELGSGFNPDFTGIENVYLNGAVLGLERQEIDSRLDDILAFADIGDFIKQPVKTYSSGMAVRLAFAVQTVVDPDIFIVDEALAVGDEKFQRKCFARLEELKQQGTSILFVSHSAPSVKELCDKALLLNEGQKLLYGDAAEVIKNYQRLIYAPPEKYLQLISEYKQAELERTDAPLLLADSSENGKQPESDEEFDPGLIPESTVRYPEQGAQIISLDIFSSNGNRVNVLASGLEYQFVIQGRFEKTCESIYFGMHIRTISGLEITGQRYPQEPHVIEKAVAGEQFRISFNYKMSLQPGIYFAGCGVWSHNEPNNLHRIIDAAMFRVAPSSESHSFGYCDLMTLPPELELS
ncbi:ABC transporter ATP-binding protein [Pseudomonas panipatensis]|uniref:Lipopolysaccharide transport system ATP-binding protein n=1 Tax=Pseudomonas panipatensis TaxID=428992 RepID=A0A1G8K226_9PSED|nr:ABC transporter ATP-binding protein [Pseudomonas panipatensis]SDI37474.1 lipopolysaccharide transport system ATP-binding protein [Pseudomonas panipatensis]SMP61182.1 lipopolysaccharide transport system ATP-binding protein [Pseudomonas panipatensis]